MKSSIQTPITISYIFQQDKIIIDMPCQEPIRNLFLKSWTTLPKPVCTTIEWLMTDDWMIADGLITDDDNSDSSFVM